MILPTIRSLKWQENALCADDNFTTELFFPEQGSSVGQRARAKKVCKQCPVKLECLENALTVPVMDPRGRTGHWVSGVWGGTVESERIAIRKARGITKEGVSDD